MSESSHALVPTGGNHPTHPAESDPIDLVEHPLAREFLVHYRATKRLSKAAEAVGIANTTYRRWLGKHSRDGHTRNPIPGFVEAFEEIHEAVLIELEDEAQRMAYEGVEEVNYKVDKDTGEETIRNRRIRQDPALIKAVLGGKMPEKYGRGDSANQVNIVIVRTDE